MMKNTMARALLDLAPWIFIAWVGAMQLRDFVHEVVPASAWMDLHGVTVSDSTVGEPIFITVTRTISKPFHARWIATVRRMTDAGLEHSCSATGENEYRNESVLPDPLTLDWWTFPIKCDLQPGKYRLDTSWLIEVPGYPIKSVTAQSNVFEVRAP